MSFEQVRFLSGWTSFDDQTMAMNGRKSTLEIENRGGDLLVLRYAYPCREEERGISVRIRIFDKTVGHFRGFYSFPFRIGFKIPFFREGKLLVTIEVDHSFFRPDAQGERKEYGILLFGLELLDKKVDPSKYKVLEAKSENLKDHFSKLLDPSREAQALPVALLIEPSSRCNMDCVMCARSMPDHQREEECDLADEFIPLLGRSMEGIQASRIQGLGEPLISRNFRSLIDLLEMNHVPIVTFNTNGYLMNEEMARFLTQKGKVFKNFRISFSLDAATRDVYDKIRGRDLNRTLKNIRYLQEYKRKLGTSNPLVIINMTLSRTNIGDLPKFIKLAHDLGVQVELSNLAVDKSYESIQVKKGNHFLFDYKKEVLTSDPELYNRYLKKAEDLGRRLNVTIHKAGDVSYMEVPPPRFGWISLLRKVFRKPFESRQETKVEKEPLPPGREKDPSYERLPLCLLPWSQMVISSRGDISLCCVQGPIDHLRNYSSIEEAWNSENIQKIREQLSKRIFPRECQTADCTVRRWKTRVCIIHQ